MKLPFLYTKSSDTEEWFDLIFNRPLGYLWARLFNHFGVHPNTVTSLSIILGCSAAWFFHYDADTPKGLLLNIVGVLLFVWADIYDSADGQLARMSGKKSQLGRILDGAAGDFWFVCVYFAIAFRLCDKPIELLPHANITWGIWSFVLCAFSGFVCHAIQCRQSDYYRTIHLHFLDGTRLDRADAERQKYQQLSWRHDFIAKLFQWFYVRHTAGQERSTPHFQKLWHTLRQRYPDGNLPDEIRHEFQRRSLPLMKYCNFITFNIRAFALYIAVLTDHPWFYPVFEITVLSAVYFYLHWRHERLSREMHEIVITNF